MAAHRTSEGTPRTPNSGATPEPSIDKLQHQHRVLHRKMGTTRSIAKQNEILRRMDKVCKKIKEIKDEQERNSARRNRA